LNAEASINDMIIEVIERMETTRIFFNIILL